MNSRQANRSEPSGNLHRTLWCFCLDCGLKAYEKTGRYVTCLLSKCQPVRVLRRDYGVQMFLLAITFIPI